MKVSYWDIVKVKSVDGPGWDARGRVQIDGDEVLSYRGSGNWDIYKLAGWDADSQTVTVGDYVRTDWSS
jgi:hypothetical protein